MNNLAYNSQDPATVGPKVEEKVREEIGASGPLTYQVEMGEKTEVTVGRFFKDIGRSLLGGRAETLFCLHFILPQPRPAELDVLVDRQGIGSHVGPILYSAKLSKPVAAEVALEPPKTFGKSKFAGDPAASEKLNAKSDLIKRANDFARTESQCGGLTVKIERFCKLVPCENGSALIVRTLSRPIKMGFGATLDAKDFFDIASMVEAAL